MMIPNATLGVRGRWRRGGVMLIYPGLIIQKEGDHFEKHYIVKKVHIGKAGPSILPDTQIIKD